MTLVEGLVVLTLIAMLAGAAYLGYSSLISHHTPRQAATQAKIIHGWLVTYADEHGGNFPTGANANAAYRELFKISVGADEKQFFIPGDAWTRGEPDGDIGQPPEYAQALAPGENSFAYVSGLTTKSTSRIPLIASAFTSQPGVWSKNKNEKGGVFQGRYAIVCRVSGSSVTHDLKDGEWMVKEKFKGQEVNIFTPGFEDTNFTVLNPQ
jgi:hypothetical protein